MKITFLGTNGWYDTDTGNTTCILAETDDAYIILDAGFGFQKVRGYIKSEKPVLLFLSHLHLDHIIGLHTLPLFNIPQGIDIYAPRGIIKDLRSFLRRPFTTPPLLLKTRIRFHDAEESVRSPVSFECRNLRHSVPCYGYRFNLKGSTLAYSTDTGICKNLKRLADGADVFITECAMMPGDKMPNLFHITPETAASVAKEAGARKLALMHFDPGNYPTLDHRRKAEDAAKAIFMDTIAANDSTVITI